MHLNGIEGLIIGLFVGGSIGCIVMGLMSAAKEADRQMEQVEMCRRCMEARK